MNHDDFKFVMKNIKKIHPPFEYYFIINLIYQ